MVYIDHDELIRGAAERFRVALERTDESLLPESLNNFPYGSGGDASILLGTYLLESGLGKFDYVAGERGSKAKNTWRSHAWLVQEDLIVDITGDHISRLSPKVIVSRDSVWHQQFHGEPQHLADFHVYDNHTVKTLGDAYRALLARIMPPRTSEVL